MPGRAPTRPSSSTPSSSGAAPGTIHRFDASTEPVPARVVSLLDPRLRGRRGDRARPRARASCPRASSSTGSRARSSSRGRGLDAPRSRPRSSAAADAVLEEAGARAGADGRPRCGRSRQVARRRAATARDPASCAPRRALALHAGAFPRALRRCLARHARRGRRRSMPSSTSDVHAPNAAGVVLESVEVEPSSRLRCADVRRLDRRARRGLGRRRRPRRPARDGCVVPLSFVPDAEPGAHLLASPGRSRSRSSSPRRHDEALALRDGRSNEMSSTRATGIALAFATALISGVSIWVNGHAVQALRGRDRLHDREEPRRGRRCSSRLASSRRGGRAQPSCRASGAGSGSRCSASAVIGGSVPFVLFFEGLARAEATQARSSRRRSSCGSRCSRCRSCTSGFGWPHALAIVLLVAGQAWLVGGAGTVAFGSGEAMILAATLLWAVEIVFVKHLLRRSVPVDSRRRPHGLRHGAARSRWVAVSGRAERAHRSRMPEQWRWIAPDRAAAHRVRRDLVRGARAGPGDRRHGGARVRRVRSRRCSRGAVDGKPSA